MARTSSRFPASPPSGPDPVAGGDRRTRPGRGAAAGHGRRPHTADLILEATGRTRNECIEQAVLGLVESFADVRDVAATSTSSVVLPRMDDVETLISVLEEAIYIVDTRGLVPAAARLSDDAAGLHVVFDVVPLQRVSSVGPAPKGVARHAIFLGRRGRVWSCRVVIDV